MCLGTSFSIVSIPRSEYRRIRRRLIEARFGRLWARLTCFNGRIHGDSPNLQEQILKQYVVVGKYLFLHLSVSPLGISLSRPTRQRTTLSPSAADKKVHEQKCGCFTEES